jgi:hypothetical protein
MALSGLGRFNPSMTTKYKQVPGVIGRFPYVDYDFDEVFEIKLQSERPRPLPAFLKSADFDDEMRRAYILKQVEGVQAAHDANNLVRDEIEYYASTGLIEKVGDTFLDNVVDEALAAAAPTVEDPVANKTAEPVVATRKK